MLNIRLCPEKHIENSVNHTTSPPCSSLSFVSLLFFLPDIVLLESSPHTRDARSIAPPLVPVFHTGARARENEKALYTRMICMSVLHSRESVSPLHTHTLYMIYMSLSLEASLILLPSSLFVSAAQQRESLALQDAIDVCVFVKET